MATAVLKTAHPQIAAPVVRHIRDCLTLAGGNAGEVLARCDIDALAIEDREHRIPLIDFVRFFETCAEQVNNPHFGLRAATLISSESLGPLSFLFLSAPTLGDAFASFTLYLDAIQEATYNAFVAQDDALSDACHFTYAIRDPDIRPRRQDSEYSIGAMCKLVRQYLDSSFAPIEIHFEHERVGKYADYQSYFRCPVFFEQPHNRMYFDRKFLTQRSQGLSVDLFPIIVGHLRDRVHFDEQSASISDRVRNMLDAAPADDLPSLEQVAAQLNMSRATLLRRLADQGDRFGTLLRGRQMGLAEKLLAESNRKIGDIALSCGYNETASFTRAFTRHSGETPKSWRQRLKG